MLNSNEGFDLRAKFDCTPFDILPLLSPNDAHLGNLLLMTALLLTLAMITTPLIIYCSMTAFRLHSL